MTRTLFHPAWRVIMVLAVCMACMSANAADRPSQVRVVSTPAGHQLQIDGQPFRIRGAGLQDGDQEALAARGANSFRTWHTADDPAHVRAMLDRAQHKWVDGRDGAACRQGAAWV
ncbi:hypothetical protein J2W68_001088 [Luteimonas terrae]|uniref:Uncharacterized protein n=1 Tax=Luteimonas terrae TaxID=1530191 RepID=A0ABU1XVW8_9GAMM|nr:hypothetical protein [Luteimonas terrae]